ncbi:MAG: ATP-binding cassette domain-containing protein [Chromatiales bacterium]|nr:ATP-binding cassette domain-containing protein [Chromatiales bacterium]
MGLLAVENLEVRFPLRRGPWRTPGMLRAVDGVSFRLGQGRTLALVGESGCGKTTVGKAILQLVRAQAGRIVFDGEDLAKLSGEDLRRRRAAFQMVFQDAYASMNPRMRIADIIAEGMITLGIERSARRRASRVEALLAEVGLPASAAQRYAHEFSGGQRQRICIARALAVNPRLVVCDEPTSALDISVQAQILNLLQSLQDSMGLSYLFITHNLSIVPHIADEMAVMYLGRIVEYGRTSEVMEAPRHPYTQALLAAVPRLDGCERETPRIAGDLPSPIAPPVGCHFHSRCPQARPHCSQGYPENKFFSVTHSARCYLY